MRLLFTLATFVGSLALFLIEPMVAKALLPSFGGSSLVWNVSLLFFQSALLGGYAYANALSRRGKPLQQTQFHLGLLAVALVLTALLLVPARLWQIHPSPEATPVWRLLLTLTLTTAAPFMVLAAGTPLIQRWFAHSDDPRAQDPYFLYAASNLGSFCGLLAYPALVEPRLTLIQQRGLVFVLLAAYAGLLLVAGQRVKNFAAAEAAQTEPEIPAKAADKTKWAALSAAPSALLLAATTDLTKNIAPIPLLWIAPLGLYLLTFVIVFSGRTRKIEEAGGAPIWLKVSLAIGVACGSTLIVGSNLPIMLAVGLSLLSFFITTLACHLQLARLRPHASQLTTYYLWVSIGGALGGLFCAILAPLFFTGFYELPIAYAATVLLFGLLQPKQRFSALDIALPIASWVAFFFLFVVGSSNGYTAQATARWVGAILLVSCLWPRPFALSYLGFILIFGFNTKLKGSKILYAARNFYGYETVTSEQKNSFHRLINGTILHGAQYTDAKRSHWPTTYYAKDGPLGQALLPLIARRPEAKLGAVGLGSGTESAYGQPGMTIDFYELNPAIKQIASNREYFTYVTDSPAKVNIILGDARLSLVDAPDAHYDAIILDAFSSDSIPVHLLTEQAFELYKRKLKPDGIILVHTSNRYLRLSDVVTATAAAAGLEADLAEDIPDADLLEHAATSWVCLATSRARFKEIEGPKSFWTSSPKSSTAPWTDDYSNVFGALRILHSG